MNKNIIEELVLEQKKSSLKNHFFDALFVNTLKYSGEIRSKEILLWRSSSWLRGAYPVFHIKFNSNDQFSGISIEKNPYHTIFGKITLILLIIFMSFPIIGRGFQEGWKASLIIPLLFVIPFLILRKLEIMEKRNLIEELKETLEDLERKYYPERFKNTPKKKKEKENQWTISKIILRIFSYPLCVLILYFCFTTVLPEGKIYHALFLLEITGAYLLADILNIIKK